MFTKRFFKILILAVWLPSITACTPRAAASTGQGAPLTLQLAVADDKEAPSQPYVLEFAAQVKELSNGNITIEPVWNAGNNTSAGFEMGVVELVKAGKFELGLAASRAFDSEGVRSFEALQAPFLITDDNLAKAVATSGVATQMLDNLSSAGLAGLTLWPEDLRHPFSLLPNKPLLSPTDFAGLNIRTTPSGISSMLVTTFGGKPMFGDNGYQGAESGLLQGGTLTGTPTATGNVTFFAKYQVLFGNDAALKTLSEAQRARLLEAAQATQKKAIAEHPSDADAARAYCADGGTVVLASAQQVAAFEAASQPVLGQIDQDALNVKLIAAIRDLKAKTPPAPMAAACTPATAEQSSAPTNSAIPSAAITITSSLDSLTTLPHRIQWEAKPVLPANELLSRVEFLIDGQLAWVEKNAPYVYGGDGNYLVTSFLTPGAHNFTTRVVTFHGQKADSTVKATVVAADAPPDSLANTVWTRYETPADIAKSTSGQPGQPGQISLTVNSVGWAFGDPQGGGAIMDVDYPSKGVVTLRAYIEAPPYPSPQGGAFCDEPDPPIEYSYRIGNGGQTLTLHPVSKDPCGDRLGAMEGTWTRSHQ